MPQQNPEIGEIWSNGTQDGLIVGSDNQAGTLTLLSRLGRQVVLGGGAGFAHVWRHVEPHVEPADCSVTGCSRRGYLRTLNMQTFCVGHVPRNQPLLFPGDPPDASRLVSEQRLVCPLCDHQHTLTSWQLIGNVLVHRCLSCRGHWVTLTARGTASDGIDLAEDLQSACNLLENDSCRNIQGLVGNHALGCLRRSFGELRNTPNNGDAFRFLGINLRHDNSHGTANITLTGTPAVSQDREHRVREIPLGSYWQHNEVPSRVLRVSAIGNDEPTVVTLFNTGDPLETLMVGSEYLLAYYHSTGVPLETAPAPSDRQWTEEMPTPAVLAVPQGKLPVTGDVWWHLGSKNPVQVLGLGQLPTDHSGALFVWYSHGRDGTRMLLSDFVRLYSPASETQRWTAGDEYEHNGTAYKIVAIEDRQVLVEAPDGKRLNLSFIEFSAYDKVSRQSALSRLLEDDEL